MPEQVKGKIKAPSGKAVLIETEDYGDIWIPYGQIEWPKNYSIKIWVSDFIANAKKMISDEELERRRAEEKKDNPAQENLPF